MLIGVDITCWANGRGYGRFTRELVPAMFAQAPEDQFVCFADARAAERFESGAANVEVRVVEQGASPTQAAAADGYRSPRDMLRLSKAVWRARPDIFFSPSVYTYFPLPPGQRAVVTVHDAIAERFPELTLPTPRARLFWNLKVRIALWQSALVLTVSDYAAEEIATVLGVPRSRIRVSGEAPSACYEPSTAEAVTRIKEQLGLPAGAEWFVYVGGFNPHKNVDILVRAHAELALRVGLDQAPYLVLVGSLDSDVFHQSVAGIKEVVASAGTESLVIWTGFLPDEDLRDVHTGALGLVLPSASEGFGLPAVEAAACGTAVIATTASPLPQLLEGGGIFVAPGDQHALAEAMHSLLTDAPGRALMGRTARASAQAMDWSAAARATLTALREVAQ
jgi:glycosyltransferase involved in cell wall biosynthesis